LNRAGHIKGYFAGHLGRIYCTLLLVLFCLCARSQADQSAQADPARFLLDSLTLDTMNGFTSLPEALKAGDKALKLVLRKQKFKNFPDEILLLKNLQYLDLSKNSIKELPEGIDSLKQLQVLILSKNRLVKLPRQIGHLKNLKILNINQNDLVALPPQIGDLENLQSLDLWSNNISVFPEQLSGLEKLRLLDLRVIMIEDDEQQRIKNMLPNTLIQFSPGCRCKTQ
jgi:Leucine-rich repeat (LRR) protein